MDAFLFIKTGLELIPLLVQAGGELQKLLTPLISVATEKRDPTPEEEATLNELTAQLRGELNAPFADEAPIEGTT